MAFLCSSCVHNVFHILSIALYNALVRAHVSLSVSGGVIVPFFGMLRSGARSQGHNMW